jgi:hypothetical protein
MVGQGGLDAKIIDALSYRPDPQRSSIMVRVCGTYLSRHRAAALATAEEIKRGVEQQLPFATPRGWTRAASERPDNPEDWAEWVGERWAAGFVQWFHQQDLPDVNAIADGTETRVPDRGDAVMATAGSLQAVLGTNPSETRLAAALAWYRRAADHGHAADCATAMIALSQPPQYGGIGPIRFSRYGKEMAPYGAMLKAAGVWS